MAGSNLPAEAIAYPETYADDAALHDLLARLRRDSPVTWVEPEGYRPFWVISKHEDIMAIERQNDFFLNGPRSILQRAEAERLLEERFGHANGLRTLVHMDDPDHRKYRLLTQAWFMPKNLKKIEARVDEIAKTYAHRVLEMGGECDFVKDLALWYPLRVIMAIFGIPDEDEPRMLKLTQELFGANDDELSRYGDDKSEENLEVLTEFFNYFQAITEDRRKNPRDDVCSIIANGEIDGKPIGELEAMSYYIIVATAGHDTTSATTAGGMQALIERPEEFRKLKENPDLIPAAVDEMIRWVTPVKQFLRTPIEDTEIRGQKIKKGDAVLLSYPSGNRDEDIFDRPFDFIADRTPNPHIAFGYGAHLCLGMYLAKMEIAAFYRHLLPLIDSPELAGTPQLMVSNFVGGLKSLPISYKLAG